MSIIVKAYLEKPDKTEEIRRFAVDHDVAASFAYLTKKLGQVFPGLSDENNYAVFWKDEEGDLIAISSDDELTLALGSIREEVFRIYIKEQPGKKNEGQVHPGVVCDVCEESIKGIRYKCTTCLDYDLCNKCEGKGLHSEHEMMRISTPRQPFGGPGPFGPFGPHPPPPCGPAGPYHPPPHFFGAWMGPHARFGGGCPRKNMKHQEQGQSSSDTKGATANDANNQQENQQGEAGPNPAFMNGNDFLKRVGESVAAMLDPFGIDVDIDVEHNGKREKAAGKKAGSGEGKGDKAKNGSKGNKKQDKTGDKKTKPEDANKGNGEQMETNEGASKKQEEQQLNDAMTVSWEAHVARDVDLGKKDDKTAEKPMETGAELPDGDWTMVNNSPSRESPATDVNNSPRETPVTSGMEVQAPSPAPAPSGPVQAGPTPGSATSNIYPPIPEFVPSEPLHQNPKIAKALKQMSGMGFSDDGGWLTRLLEAKDGDIGLVLDAIHPNRRQ